VTGPSGLDRDSSDEEVIGGRQGYAPDGKLAVAGPASRFQPAPAATKEAVFHAT
jgi:hypothetical protein